jgi:5-methylcytosine-specific restriction endonuclease McrA
VVAAVVGEPVAWKCPWEPRRRARSACGRFGRPDLNTDAQKTRSQRLREFARRYRRRYLFGQSTCTYCGMPSDTWDHVPAVSVAYDVTCEWLERNGYGLWLVPACRQCNGRLGSRRLFTVEERAKVIWRGLHRDLEAITSAEWTTEELSELGPRLGAYVRAGADHVLVLKHRIAWADGVSTMTRDRETA